MVTASSNEQQTPEIQKLSDEQDKLLVKYAREWQHVWREQQINRDEVTLALRRLYKLVHTEAPQIVWCESPWQLVMTRAILILHAITSGDDEFHARLEEELNSPLWKRLWQNYDKHKEALKLPCPESEQSFNFETVAGTDYTSQMTLALCANVTAAQDLACDKLSVPVKLRLREVFRQATEDANEVRIGNDRLTLMRGQWGLLSLGGLVGNNAATQLLSALSPELQQKVREVCREKLKPKPNPFSIFAREQQPEEELFAILHEQLHSPVQVMDLRHVAFVVRHLPLEFEPELKEPIIDWLTLKENVFHVEARRSICFLCEAPKHATVNERNQLHNDTGAAMEFSDGFKLFAWSGVVVPAEAVESTDKLSIDQIDKEQNAEVRRILIQQYGLERYLEDSGARQIDADEFGVLYKKSLPNDEPVVVVKVTNRTPEPDGSRKFYFLRVPPYMTSARNAVAWTFNMSPDEYAPNVQT